VLGVHPPEGITMHEALAAHVQGRRMLILLDNAEHLLPELVDELGPVVGAVGPSLLVTSRERLGLTDEHVFAVPALDADDAVEFFRTRASMLGIAVEPGDALATLCERLDRLPLALQLAAARLPVFSIQQILDRLSQKLDLLKGARDAEPRHATIRATIEWSHELLSEEERLLFRRLAVFVGGATLEAAEDVCDAHVDVLHGLLDKSLVQRREDAPEPRFWMLESIGDFARGRLSDSGELVDLRYRHADRFAAFARSMGERLLAGEPEEGPVSLLHADIDNLRAAVAFALETADTRIVREVTAALPMYWVFRGLYREARSWLDRAIELEPHDDATQRRLLSGLAMIAYAQGDHVVAVKAADDAAALAMQLTGATERYAALRDRAFAAMTKGEWSAADEIWGQTFEAAAEADNGVGMSACRINRAYGANRDGRHEQAASLLGENLPFVRSRGQTRCEATTLGSLAETSVYRGRPQDAAGDALLAARRALQIDDVPTAAWALDMVALSSAARGDGNSAATILAATEVARESLGAEPDDDEQGIRERALSLLDEADAEAAWTRGRSLDLGAALELASSVLTAEPVTEDSLRERRAGGHVLG
jgi:predicted ATPase